eukprot:TRINITY_DN11401_c0_g1_i1.p2 TRINITY_DN11401_c0_g1~~TRINITY_DN11401_c0_g1_i1.p2  ORF type:complete len:207 (+),score=94.41 TRINITY_DN11401_c0_g1_i1:87-623(+)
MFACCAAPGADSAETIKVEPDADQEKKAAEEQAAKAAAAAKKAEEEEQAKKKAEEETAAKKAEEEAAANKKAEEEAAAKAKADAAAVEEYEIELTMDSEKTPIGIELKQPSCIVKSFRDGALVAKYNAAYPAQKVAVGDKLISFNGCGSGDIVPSIKKAYSELSAGAKMTLKFSRGGK